MQARPTPLLADLFLASKADQPGTQAHVDAVRRGLQRSRHYILDDAGVRRYAETLRDLPDLIVQQHDFARPPYDVCWVEFSYRVFFETLTGTPAHQEADERVGYLFDHDRVSIVAGGGFLPEGDLVALMPIAYYLHDPWRPGELQDFCDRARTSLADVDSFLWGTTVLALEEDDRPLLRHRNRWKLHSTSKLDETTIFRMLHGASSGDLRNIVALMLLLNRPSLTRQVAVVDRRKLFFRGRQRPLLPHHVVTIDIDPTPTLMLIGTEKGDGVPRRQHEVRGHYCHDRTSRAAELSGCVHRWIDDAAYADDSHWTCEVCLGRRWRRRSHWRGDAQSGVVEKTYRVTASSEDISLQE